MVTNCWSIAHSILNNQPPFLQQIRITGDNWYYTIEIILNDKLPFLQKIRICIMFLSNQNRDKKIITTV